MSLMRAARVGGKLLRRCVRRAWIMPSTAALAAGILLSTPGATGATDGGEHYPNLKTVPATDLRFAKVNGQAVLRFSNTVWNAGEGPLELLGQTIQENGQSKTKVSQRIYSAPRSTGTFTEIQLTQGFVYHAGHGHWHFEDFAQYDLFAKQDYDKGNLADRRGHGVKTTFCIMDTKQVVRNVGGPTSAFYSQCGQQLQGLSVGWADTYGWRLDDQWVVLEQGGLVDGDYALRSIADPQNRIYESLNKNDVNREGAADNQSVTYFRVRGGRITLL